MALALVVQVEAVAWGSLVLPRRLLLDTRAGELGILDCIATYDSGAEGRRSVGGTKTVEGAALPSVVVLRDRDAAVGRLRRLDADDAPGAPEGLVEEDAGVFCDDAADAVVADDGVRREEVEAMERLGVEEEGVDRPVRRDEDEETEAVVGASW